MLNGETDHCRARLQKYCQGIGIDLGCGASKIKIDAIGIDLYHPKADMRKDARLLEYYPDNLFDFVFSSHLLEEIENTEEVLKEWLRVLKPQGFLVLYQADKDLYYPLSDPRCNPNHKHHFSWQELWAILEKYKTELVLGKKSTDAKEWSFELVIRKAK